MSLYWFKPLTSTIKNTSNNVGKRLSSISSSQQMFKSWIKDYQNFLENLLKLSHEFKKPNANPAEQEEQKNVNKIKSGNLA